MKLDAISVGKQKEMEWEGRKFMTSIFKTPLSAPVQVSYTNIEGDQQSDLKLHGGLTRPVSVYPSEYYEFWKKELDTNDLPWGYFGENLNINGGVFEQDIQVGDRFAIGTVEFEALQPRFPCHKLAMKMGDSKWIKLFLDSGKTGFYFGVVKEGTIAPGDKVNQIHKEKDSISIQDITNLYFTDKNNKDLLERALNTRCLTPSWKEYFKKQLTKTNRT